MLDGPPDDAAADVAATLVGGRDAVGDQERHRAAVVGEHAVGLRGDGVVAVCHSGLGLDPVHDQPEAVAVEHGVDALQQAGAALDAEAGVDVLLGQRHELGARPEVVFHEDEVVELHVAVALAAGRAVVAPAAVLGAAVEEDLGAGPAQAGLPRLPEVVLAEPHDPVGRDPDPLPRLDRDGVLAEAERRVALMDGRPEQLRIELHVLGDELPRRVDCFVLEVVAEREVAHHLEERAVAVGAPDVLQVGVLAARAEHLLDAHDARCGRLTQAEEVRLELLHPRDDEERRGVIRRRDQRVRGHAQMAAFLVEPLETLA